MNCVVEVLDTNPKRDIIINTSKNLSIEVFAMFDEFLFDPEEIQYYGDDHGDPLIFQTVGYSGQQTLDIELSILWYAANLLDYPDMELRTEE